MTASDEAFYHAEVRRLRAVITDKDRQIAGLVRTCNSWETDYYEAERHAKDLAAWMRVAIEYADYGGVYKALAEYDKWADQ